MLQPLQKQALIEQYNQSRKRFQRQRKSSETFRQRGLQDAFVEKLNALIVSINQSASTFSVPKSVQVLAERYRSQRILLKERMSLLKAKQSIHRIQAFERHTRIQWTKPERREALLLMLSGHSRQYELRNLLERWLEAGVFTQHNAQALLHLAEHSLPLLISHFQESLASWRLRRMPKIVRHTYRAYLQTNLAQAEACLEQIRSALLFKLEVLDRSGFATSQGTYYLAREMQKVGVSLPHPLPKLPEGNWVDINEEEFVRIQQLLLSSKSEQTLRRMVGLSWFHSVEGTVTSAATLASSQQILRHPPTLGLGLLPASDERRLLATKSKWGWQSRRAKLRIAFHLQHFRTIAKLKRMLGRAKTVQSLEALTFEALRGRLLLLTRAVEQAEQLEQSLKVTLEKSSIPFWVRKQRAYISKVDALCRQSIRHMLKQQVAWLSSWRFRYALQGEQVLSETQIEFFNQQFSMLEKSAERHKLLELKQSLAHLQSAMLPVLVESRTLVYLQHLVQGDCLSHQHWRFAEKNMNHYQANDPNALRLIQRHVGDSLVRECKLLMSRLNSASGFRNQVQSASMLSRLSRLFSVAKCLGLTGQALQGHAGVLRQAFLQYINWIASQDFLHVRQTVSAVYKVEQLNAVFKFLLKDNLHASFYFANRSFSRILHDISALHKQFGVLANKQGSQFLMLRLKSQAQGLLSFDRQVTQLHRLIMGGEQLLKNIEQQVKKLYPGVVAQGAYLFELRRVFAEMQEHSTADVSQLQNMGAQGSGDVHSLYFDLPRYIQRAIQVCAKLFIKKVSLDRFATQQTTFDYGSLITELAAVAHNGHTDVSGLQEHSASYQALFYQPKTGQYLFQEDGTGPRDVQSANSEESGFVVQRCQ